jgi:hypothetical protein
MTTWTTSTTPSSPLEGKYGAGGAAMTRSSLGVILEGDDACILGAEDKCIPVYSESYMEGEREFLTVWIHSDNNIEAYGGTMNQHSGVRVLGTEEESTLKSQETGGSTYE